jgi:hypothetical protein
VQAGQIPDPLVAAGFVAAPIVPPAITLGAPQVASPERGRITRAASGELGSYADAPASEFGSGWGGVFNRVMHRNPTPTPVLTAPASPYVAQPAVSPVVMPVPMAAAPTQSWGGWHGYGTVRPFNPSAPTYAQVPPKWTPPDAAGQAAANAAPQIVLYPNPVFNPAPSVQPAAHTPVRPPAPVVPQKVSQAPSEPGLMPANFTVRGSSNEARVGMPPTGAPLPTGGVAQAGFRSFGAAQFPKMTKLSPEETRQLLRPQPNGTDPLAPQVASRPTPSAVRGQAPEVTLSAPVAASETLHACVQQALGTQAVGCTILPVSERRLFIRVQLSASGDARTVNDVLASLPALRQYRVDVETVSR